MIHTFNRFVRFIRFYGGGYVCNVCGYPVRNFFPFSKDLQNAASSAGFLYSFQRMETLNFTKCNCPFCLASDRERLYLLYLEMKFKDDNQSHTVLDFAPSKAFARAIKNFKNVAYTTADYFIDGYDLKLDVCNMKDIPNGSYSLVICSHVLEHVDDPDKALSEIFRIIKSGGAAILMVPLFFDVETTIEDSSYNTDYLRCKAFGQADHVRLFAKQDFENRIKKASFELELITPVQLPQDLVEKYAIAENSVLYLGHKK